MDELFRNETRAEFADVRGKLDGVSAFLQVIADRLGGEEEGDDRAAASAPPDGRTLG
jgi:hypothetical protein